MSVFVDGAAFRNTVHKGLRCTDCHPKTVPGTHPGSVYASRDAFSRDASAACLRCHDKGQITAKPHHAFTAAGGDVPPCTACHGGHDIRRISALASGLTENQYCLLCHGQRIGKTLPNGDWISLLIDTTDLAASVHNRHACSQCHAGYTRQRHPSARHGDSREHSIALSGVCAGCHDNKAAAVRNSVHYNLYLQLGETMISRGNPRSPVCTDCHGFHEVGPAALFRTLSGTPCRKCHAAVFEVYAKSVHGMASAQGKHAAPLCSSCHFAHDIGFTAGTGKMKAACTGCHEKVEASHRKWLPNADLHLSVIACAACHAPKAEKGIYLILHDQAKNRPVTREDLVDLLGADAAKLAPLVDRHGEGLDSAELSYMLRRLEEKGLGAGVTFLGRMDVNRYSDAHALSLKRGAVRECGSCHAPDAPFLKNVNVAIINAPEGMTRLRAAPGVLKSAGAVGALRQFYMLGGTRLSLLDWFGLAVVGGAVAVVGLHLAVRMATAPGRRARAGGIR